MGRKPRLNIPGAVYHVILRGNAQQDIFFRDEDRTRFYQFIQEGIEHFGYRIHAFCCMTNHVHLVVQVGDYPLAKIIQNLCLRHTLWINKCQKRTGHLFQGRYKAILIDTNEYLLGLVGYIHLNPVRAHLVGDPKEYRWSGHQTYLGKEKLSWLTTEWVLGLFSQDIHAARRHYEAFVLKRKEESYRPEFHRGIETESRVLGNDTFITQVLNQSHINTKQEKIFSLNDVIEKVCKTYRLTKADIAMRGKNRISSEARAMTALIVRESQYLSLTELSHHFGRDISTLSAEASRLLRRAKQDNALMVRIHNLHESLT